MRLTFLSLLMLVTASPLAAAETSSPPAPPVAAPAAVPDPAAGAAEPAADPRPLSSAQTALFETPHLKAIGHPETLAYRFERTGPDPLVDKVAIHIVTVYPDSTKLVTFDFLTGAHHHPYPSIDHFSGNPLLMVFLEHDVTEMRDQIGIAAAYFRNRVREAFIDQATVTTISYKFGDRTVPAQLITLKPFAHVERLEKLPAIQQNEYRFVLSDAVPGQLAELATTIPADPASGGPVVTETLSFTGEAP